MKLFNVNLSPNEAFLRGFAGLILLALMFAGQNVALGWIGALLILTGAMRRCPAYLLVGINTQRK